MAQVASLATGNASSSSTWALLDSTSFQNVESGTLAITTTYQTSTTFTPGAITIDAILVKISSRLASPTGTLTVALDQATVDVTGTVVTCNVSDVSRYGGWHCFKFAAPITLSAATAYGVKIKTSSSGQVIIYTSGTNYSKTLRTTTTQSPTTGDTILVLGDITGAGSTNTRTVTWDITATTAFGPIETNNYGTLTFGTTASTAYYMKCQDCKVWGGGVMNVGTSGTPLPGSSSAILEFNSGSAAQYGLFVENGGTFNAYGATKSAWATKLGADLAAAATSLTLVSTTDWAVSDEIVIATTTRTASQTEKKTLNTVPTSTTATITAGASAAHDGTGTTAAEVLNLTRNVKIRGVTQTNSGYIWVDATGSITMRYVEMTNMGSNTSPKFGLYHQVTASGGGTFDVQFCSYHDTANNGWALYFGSTADGAVTFSNNIVYNVPQAHVNMQSGTGTSAVTISGNYFLTNSTNNPLIDLNSPGVTCTNNTCVSSTNSGIRYNSAGTIGTHTGNICHSNATHGVSFEYTVTTAGTINGTIGTLTTWRNNDHGVYVKGMLSNATITLDTWTSTGELNGSLGFDNSFGGIFTLKSCTFNVGTTLTCPRGIRLNNITTHSNIYLATLYVDSCTFGNHSTGNFDTGGVGAYFVNCRNCTFGTTILASQSNISMGYIASDRHGGTNGAFRLYKGTGTLQFDTTIYGTASPSLRLTPLSGSVKLSGGRFRVAVPNGDTPTVSIKLRRSVVGDGAAHNGNFPRLMLAANPALGITSDTVIGTATSASNGAFETVSGTLPSLTGDGIAELYVDTDGTAGWVNADDFSTSENTANVQGLSFGLAGEPWALLGGSTSGGTTNLQVYPTYRRVI